MFLKVSLVIALLVAVVLPVCAVQMVQNGDFESSALAGWTADNRYPGSPATLYSAPAKLNDYPMAEVYNGSRSVGWYRTDGIFSSSVPGGEEAGGGSINQTWSVTPGTYSVHMGAAVFIHNDRLEEIEDFWGSAIQIRLFVDNQTTPVWEHVFWSGEGDSFWRRYTECTNQTGSRLNQIITTTGTVKMQIMWRTRWDTDLDLCAVDDVSCDLVLGGAISDGSTAFTFKAPPTWSAPLAQWNPVLKTYHWPCQGPVPGGNQFHQASEYKVGLHPTCAAAGDFNGDGLMDLAVANEWSHTVTILLGTGNDGFVTFAEYPAGLNPTCVQVAQVAGDNAPDLLVTCKGSSQLLVFRGIGDGSFAAPLSTSTWPGPTWVCCGDFNSDGKTDAVVAQLSDGSFSTFLGNGDGTFVRVYNNTNGGGPAYIAAADFNHDSKLDLVVSKFYGGVNSIMRGNGDGTFTGATDLNSGWQALSCAVGDFNGDSYADVFTLAAFDSACHFFERQPSQGAFAFYDPLGAKFITAIHPSFTTAFDFDQDGRTDVATGMIDSCDVLVHRAGLTGPASYTQLGYFGSGDTIRNVLAADVNRDGYPDMVVCSAQTQTVNVIYGGPNGTFCAPKTQYLDSSPQTRGLALGDLDNDGDMDAAVSGISDKACQVFALESRGNLDLVQRFKGVDFSSPFTGANPLQSCDIADFNGDGLRDIVASGGTDCYVYLTNGTALNYPTLSDQWMGTSLQEVKAADLNNDGKQDIIADDGASGLERLLVKLGTGTGGFGATLSTSIGKAGPKDIAIGDFNNDGKRDVVITFPASNQFVLMTGKGDGKFNSPVTFNTGTGPSGIAVCNLNADVFPDVVVANRTAGTVSVFLGNGAGGFVSKPDVVVGPSPIDLCSADFDLDGKADLAVGNQGDFTFSYLKGNGDGTFQNQQVYRTSGRPERIAAGDTRGIGVPDVVVTLSRNYKPEVFANALLPAAAPVVTASAMKAGGLDVVSASWTPSLFRGKPIVQYRWAVSAGSDPSGIVAGGEWRYVGVSTSAARSISLPAGGTYRVLVQALDSANLRSPVGVSNSAYSGVVPAGSAADAKLFQDGTRVKLSGKIVSRVFTGTPTIFYVQEAGRFSGIRIRVPQGVIGIPTVGSGYRVDLTGTLATDQGERLIDCLSLDIVLQGTSPEPLGLNGFALGGGSFTGVPSSTSTGQTGVAWGVGLSNIGLLMRICGQVTVSDSATGVFYVDDGSSLEDGSTYAGVRCLAGAGGALPSVGKYVTVTGVSSVDTVSDHHVRCLRIAATEDIIER